MSKGPSALPPLLQEFVDEVAKACQLQDNELDDWGQYVMNQCVPEMDEALQEHLKGCARCRFQSTVPKRKKRDDPIVVPSERDLQSLCDVAIAELCTSSGCGKLVSAELAQQFEAVQQATAAMRPSAQDTAFVKALLDTGHDVTFENLRLVKKEAGSWLEHCRSRMSVVDRVTKQEAIVGACAKYYKDNVVPMALKAEKSNAVSGGQLYVIDPELFQDAVDGQLAALHRAAVADAQAWEDANKKPFLIDDQRFLDMPCPTLLGAVTPPSTPSKGSGSGAGKGTPKRPSTPQRTPQGKARPPASPAPATPGPVAEVAGLQLTKPVSLNRKAAAGRFLVDVDNFKDDEDHQGMKVSVDKSSTQGEGVIQVCVRIRPLVVRERQGGHKAIVKKLPDGRSVQIVNKSGAKERKQQLEFQTVCDGEVGQDEFFRVVGMDDLLAKSLDGFNTTVFAYGQTGSGKTYTISGPADVLGIQRGAQLEPDSGLDDIVREVVTTMLANNLAAQGVVPRVANRLFETITDLEKNENIRVRVKVSYLEIYNEQIQDLLSTDVVPLKVREAADGTFFVEGLREQDCENVQELLDVVVRGTSNRRVTAHEMNSESSRSHAVLTIKLTKLTYDPASDTMWVKRGKMNVIDLAGSESVKLTKTAGTALRETAGINKSLLSLSNIISKLSELSAQRQANPDKEDDAQHIPWRNSKLTMLLMDSLSGAGTTLMVAACSPSGDYYAETSATLQFAVKAGNITRKAMVSLSPHELEVLRLKEQIDKLQALYDGCQGELEQTRKLLANRDHDVLQLRNALAAARVPIPQLSQE